MPEECPRVSPGQTKNVNRNGKSLLVSCVVVIFMAVNVHYNVGVARM